MEQSKELSDIFNSCFGSYFDINPPGYSDLDLHFIHDFHFRDYLLHITHKLYYIAFSESGERLYSKLYFYCVDDDVVNSLHPFVENINLSLRNHGLAEFILLEKISADIQELIVRINQQPDKSACIIFDAEKFSGSETFFEKRFNQPGFPQDKQQIVDLLNVLKTGDDKFTKKGYVACHSRLAPVVASDDFNTFVNDIKRLSIFDFYAGGERHQKMFDAINEAQDFLKDNHINSAKEAIERCKEIKDPKFVFIQIFNEFNNNNNKMYAFHLHEMLKNLDIDSDFSTHSGLNMVDVCVGAESYPAARKILKKIAEELADQDEIEKGVQLAGLAGCSDISAELIKKLEKSYPGSLVLNYRDINSALREENYQRAAELFSLRDDELSQKKHQLLLQFITWLKQGDGDIVAFLQTQDINDPDTVHFLNHIASTWAVKHQDYLTAIAVSLFYEPVLDDETFINNSDRILKKWFFNRKKSNTDEDKKQADIVSEAIISFTKKSIDKLSHLSVNPYLRERFIDRFSWDVSHSFGHFLLILITRNQFSGRELNLSHAEPQASVTMPLETVMSKVEDALNYYDRIGVVLAGKHLVPADILTGDRAELRAFLQGLHILMLKMAGDLQNEREINNINALISIANSAASLAAPCYQDLDIIKNVGAVLSLQGYAQAARDLAEQALQLAGDDPQRQRHAWLAAAEIYQRQGNNHPAMVYLNCAMSGSEMTIDEFFTYSNLAVRIFRDTKAVNFARDAVTFSRRILQEFNNNLYIKNKKIYDFMDLTLCFNQLCSDDVFDSEIAEKVVSLATGIASEEVVHADNLSPILTLSLQIADVLAVNNYTADDDFKAVLEQMISISDAMNIPDKLLNAFTAFYRESNINNLFALYNLISSSSRSAGDRAWDDNSLHIYAALLLRRNPDMPLQDRAFAAELLTDSSYSLHSEYLYSNPYPRYERIDAPADYAAACALENKVAVYLLVLDDHKHGTLLCWLPGMDGQEIDSSLWHFDFAAFNQWKKEFPYQYGFYDAETTPNLFFDSTEFIRFDFDFHEKSVLILDVQLQSLVPNLIPLPSGLAGTQAAISCAPSLAWLEQTRRTPVKTNGNLVSWISTADLAGQTLKAMADEFSQEGGVFDKWNVAHNGDSALPVGFENSELVIIGAHGGVTDAEHVFRSISDEGDLRIDFSTFSSRLRQCGVVILFVCSSGRFDNHPEAATTIGLAKELLDNGCAAVISSPWPLDPMLTMRWLPLFMEQWMGGATVSDAVFETNKTLTSHYSYDYSKCIALSVFGDGSRRYQKKVI
ncbi:CHAT domain-containing protein [Erwinia sorbitola]|uniref:CHAT domain-containing protein n=1 Tax=Erwinia sorbitola TaxID=2681984 RepID=A0A6I6ETT3_9GAMM|nr:CHAT domain-containing protein [Erwinia sorbitola]QGU87932.1 CHAT domain-containing protein [Erwinia sorbitola]